MRLRGIVAVILAAGIGWFYHWTVNPDGKVGVIDRAGQQYYNLLARGFLKGQVALDLVPSPELVKLPNPYDPALRGNLGLHDASYYRGRYHLYFGVTPTLLLSTPFLLLTGKALGDEYAVLAFSLAGFAIGVLLWRAILRRVFPGAGFVVEMSGVIALGLANLVPLLLRRPAFWEVPIACAYALAMLALYFGWRSASAGRPGTRWLALASAAMGLCVGARVTYLFAAALLLPLLLARARATGRWKSSVAAALVPIALVGVGLAWFNYARYDNPLEFGHKYQLSGDDPATLQSFGLRYFVFNLRLYLFSAPGFSPYFPFVTVITPPPVPKGQFGIEDPFGILPACPWVLLALATIPIVFRPGSPLRAWVASAWLAAVLAAGVIFCFGGATGRYEVDFAPALVLLGCVGAAALAGLPSWVSRAAIPIAAALCLWSSAVNVLVSIRHNRLLELNHPGVYARTAHAFNRLGLWADRLTGARYGPVELKVVFPRGATGEIEPLVVTGAEFLSDYVYVHYLGDDLVRFGFEHTSRRSAVGAPFKIVPGEEQTVLVQMGSLFPPAGHPYFDALPAADAESRMKGVTVRLNGQTALTVVSETYDSTSRKPSVGTSGPRPAFKRDFSGRIVAVRRVDPLPPPEPVKAVYGALHLTVKFPPFSSVRGDPILCSGVGGAGDSIYVTYLDSSHLVFGHDHWGSGAGLSEPVEFKPGVATVIDISCPALLGPGAAEHLEVKMDGRVVFARDVAFHPVMPGQVWVGENPIGMSTSAPRFTGEIVTAERVAPGQ